MLTVQFDRGTLRFSGQGFSGAEGESALMRGLPGVAWDRRIGAYRAPPWRYPEIALRLADERLAVRWEATAFGAVTPGAWAELELRPYQLGALAAWERSRRRGILALPTGSGKTRIAVAAMARLGCATLCIVPTRVLLHQWRKVIGESYRGPVGIWGDGERQLESITVITAESAFRQMPRIGNRFQLLVVDEAHHFGLGGRDEALEMAIAPWRLGLTATPPRDEIVTDELERLIGPIVYQRSVHDLAGRYLADFDLMTLHIPLEQDERREYDALMAVFRPVRATFRRFAPGAQWSDFVAWAGQSAEGRAALAAWRAGRRLAAFTRGKGETLAALLAEHRERRVLIFTADNATAYAIARRHFIMPITCDIRRAERDEALAKFARGELRALVSARVLNEGVDVPDADVAVIVGGALGEREHVQRIGRLLRPAPGKRAAVYELIADGTSEIHQAMRRRHGLGSPRALAV